jgi:hypothetical protein
MTIHLIVRASGDGGVSARSPQCPGLSVGRPSAAELRADLNDILSFYFNATGPFDVAGHEENAWDIDGIEVVVRCAADGQYRERTSVAERVLAALRDFRQRADLLSYPPDRVGEHLFLAVVATDTIGWIASQLDDTGEPAVIAAAVGEGLIWTTVVSYGDPTGEQMPEPSETVAELPDGADTTVGDMMRSAPLLRPVGRRLVHP